MQDTKIIGRIDRHWKGGTGSDSSPIFEGDTHEFNADTLRELKQHIKEYHEAQAARDAYNRARIGEK